MNKITDKSILSRSQRLLGDENMERLQEARIIVFGVGGVGSWCVESLVRSGVKHITIVDSDIVSPSNINRQLMATTLTVGRVKVDAMKEHLLTVNPSASIDTRQMVFTTDTADEFDLDSYDYIIDCIDSLKDKILLIDLATKTKARFFSSMGAALKIDPTRVKVGEFWNVKGCPLARAIRQRFKKMNHRPARKFQCVYSDELVTNLGNDESGTNEPNPWNKACVNGSLMHITAIFGLTLAGLVIKDLTSKSVLRFSPVIKH